VRVNLCIAQVNQVWSRVGKGTRAEELKSAETLWRGRLIRGSWTLGSERDAAQCRNVDEHLSCFGE
jgi:hypothetical protein